MISKHEKVLEAFFCLLIQSDLAASRWGDTGLARTVERCWQRAMGSVDRCSMELGVSSSGVQQRIRCGLATRHPPPCVTWVRVERSNDDSIRVTSVRKRGMVHL